MKYLFFSLVLFVAGSVSAEETTSSKGDDSKVIVVQEGNGKLLQSAPKVFVESGSTTISGSPEAGIKGAYRTWEQKCSEWRNDLQRLNGKNLMVADCGTATRSQEKIQSESLYTYQSKATYKIKVLGK